METRFQQLDEEMEESEGEEEYHKSLPSKKSQMELLRQNFPRLQQPYWRALSFELSNAEMRGIDRALGEVETQKMEIEDEGLNQFTFFIGIVNVVVTTAIFCKWPEYLWLFYGVECAFFIPAWWYKMTTETNGFLYIIEICWLTSSFFGAYMLCTFAGLVSASTHEWFFPLFYSCSMAFLSWFCVILFAGLVFHSLDKTASLFIHFTPCLVSYTFKFNIEAVAATMPGVPLDVLDPAKFITYHNGAFPNFFFYVDKIFLAGWHFYMIWWLSYGAWLLSVGVDAPYYGFNTVYDNLYTRARLGEVFKVKLGLQSRRSHAMIYLLIHWSGVTFSFFMAPFAFWGPETGYWATGQGIVGAIIVSIIGALNAGRFGALAGVLFAAIGFNLVPAQLMWIIVVFLSAIWNGAGHYDFIFAKKYTKVLQALLDDDRGASSVP